MSRSTRALGWTALGALLLLVGSIAFGVTAANSVVTTRADDSSRAATPNDLKPPACAGITVTAKVSGSGTFSGTNAAELITGSAADDSILARGRNDCVLGGAGDDTLNGGAGTDVCIGGAGANTYTACETII